MGIMVYRDQAAASAAVATLVASQLIEKPNSVLAVMASSRSLPIYRQLGAMTSAGILDWNEAEFFLTSEILNPDNIGIFDSYISHYLYNEIGIPAGNVHAPRHNTQHVDDACTAYEADIASAGGVDLLLLPIESTAHLAYNLAGNSLTTLTHTQPLPSDISEECRKNYSLSFQGNLQMITMGISTLMSAKRIVVCAFGSDMVKTTDGMLAETVSTAKPLSLLQLHPSITFALDEAAAAHL